MKSQADHHWEQGYLSPSILVRLEGAGNKARFQVFWTKFTRAGKYLAGAHP